MLIEGAGENGNDLVKLKLLTSRVYRAIDLNVANIFELINNRLRFLRDSVLNGNSS